MIQSYKVCSIYLKKVKETIKALKMTKKEAIIKHYHRYKQNRTRKKNRLPNILHLATITVKTLKIEVN